LGKTFEKCTFYLHLVYILFNRNVLHDFGDGVRGTRKLDKHCTTKVVPSAPKKWCSESLATVSSVISWTQRWTAAGTPTSSVDITGASLSNEGLHQVYSSQNTASMIKLRKNETAGHVARIGKMRYTHKILVGK